MADTSMLQSVGTRNLTSALSSASRSNQTRSIKELANKVYVIQNDLLVEAWLPESFMLDVSSEYNAPFQQGISNALGSTVGDIARFLGMSLTTQAMTLQVWEGGSFGEITIPFLFQAESDAYNDVLLPFMNLFKMTMPKDPSGGGILESPGPRVDMKKLSQQTMSTVTQAFDNLTGVAKSAMQDPSSKVFSVPGAINTVQNAANSVARPISQAIVSSITNNISLYIGRAFYFPSVVVKDVSPTVDSMWVWDANPDNIGKYPSRATINVTFRMFFLPTDKDIETIFVGAAR